MNATQRKTTWTDGMILAAIREHEMLTPQARERAYELADLGLVDMAGLWNLTPAGEKLADK